MANERLPIISMYGPWANWVGLGWKTIETRLHDRFRGLSGQRIGIHVAKRWDEWAFSQAASYMSKHQIEQHQKIERIRGAIRWTAFVRECRWLTQEDSEAAMIDCGFPTQRFGLILEDVIAIEPIFCKGKQGIWYHEVPSGRESDEEKDKACPGRQ